MFLIFLINCLHQILFYRSFSCFTFSRCATSVRYGASIANLSYNGGRRVLNLRFDPLEFIINLLCCEVIQKSFESKVNFMEILRFFKISFNFRRNSEPYAINAYDNQLAAATLQAEVERRYTMYTPEPTLQRPNKQKSSKNSLRSQK